MNFQGLAKVESASVYLDIGFRAARIRQKPVIKEKDALKLAKTNEYVRVDTVARTLTKSFRQILSSFPSVDSLPEFYLELLRTSTDYNQLKKSLGAVNWAEQRVQKLAREYLKKIKSGKNANLIKGLRTQFYGRVSSIVKQIDKELKYIDSTRIIMKRFPTIKTSAFTVAIAGYPNVGKSSLLKVLTGAEPEIKDYAFTTKNINIGYMSSKKLQIVDIPGTFDRDDMNSIEKQAYLVLRHVADAVIFLLDTTESSGYSMKEQKQLLRRVKDFKKPIIVVISKCDLVNNKSEQYLNISVKTKEGISELIKLIKEHEANSQ